MKREFLLGATALLSTVGSLAYDAGSFTPAFLVGEMEAPLGSTEVAAGSIAGDVVQTSYGPVQVTISISGGSITEVALTQAPTGRNAQWTNYAAPILIQEAMQAQSADIAMVSGATYTSQGFVQSLQSAINQM
jgi:uncharacterized protein with FMN-binding domain